MPAMAMVRMPRPASSARKSFADRISPYRRPNDSGMTTNGRIFEGVSPAISTSTRIGAPLILRSLRSNVKLRSMRALVFRVTYDDVTNVQRLIGSPTHVRSAYSASSRPESAPTSGRLSASAKVREKPTMRPSGAK